MAAKGVVVNPVVYDYFSMEKLLWPSLSCRWGGLLKQDKTKTYHHIYFSEQTGKNDSNTLILAECEVARPNVTSMTQISEASSGATKPPSHMKRIITIIHPGEVNKIRDFPQYTGIVATHTDSPDVLVWDVNQQNDHVDSSSVRVSVPNMILKGHKEIAEYALAMSPNGPFVLSGGKDKSVIFWNIEDHISSSVSKSGSATEVQPRGVFQGHQDTVNAVHFNPNCSQEFCSVGDDSYLMTWDARASKSPTIKIKDQVSELYSVDWSKEDEKFILTGSSDGKVRIIDLRVYKTVHTFEGHDGNGVLNVQWCPEKGSVFGSTDSEGVIKIWDHEKVNKGRETGGFKTSGDGLVLEHVAHRGMVHDFHWNPHDPWTVASVSDDAKGGGNLQIWRMTDFLYKPEQEALAALERLMRRNGGYMGDGKV